MVSYLFGHGNATYVVFLVLWILSPGVTTITYDTIIDLFEEQTGLLDASNKSPQSNSETPTPERIVDYIEQTRAAWQELADVVKEANVTEQMDLEFQHPDKVLITLNDSLTFNSGSDVLLPLAELVLSSVAICYCCRAITGRGTRPYR